MAEMRVFVENDVTMTVSEGSQPIDTNIAGQDSPLTTNTTIVGQPISTTITGTPTVTVGSQPIQVTEVKSPTIGGVYSFLLNDATGVVAANNYVSLFNPVGSGKNIITFSTSVSSYITGGGSTSKNSMIVSRITTATVGTLQAASAINKFSTSFANPVAEVRTGNPTVTLGAQVLAFPPPVTNDTAIVSERVVGSGATGPIVLAPGEGVVFGTAAGDTDQNWNISFAWGESV